ncbi:ABC transporter permease subunit [bacterium]|nr:ABC transporter permease subunit [bacterium]NIN93189.1 ABC transporter permease subunit [bacterium]NIO18986.1 ABC transporter permease subunit [bacterium]NIO74115.1 ABC transporter permease subunit [bacterium]
MENILGALTRALGLIISLDKEVFSIVLLSFSVSLTAVFFSSLISLPLSLLLALKKFPGHRFIVNTINSLMAVPAVAIGLVIYLVISRRGPLGALELLYTPWAMIIAQAVLVTPIITSLSLQTLKRVGSMVKETAVSLGASGWQLIITVVKEAKSSLMAAFIVGFARVIGETGMTMMVGGNIKGVTRVMTTAIALETMKGDFELAVALGIILLIVAFGVNIILQTMQGAGR